MSQSLKVLLAYRSDVDVQGGAGYVMQGTAAGLRKLGVQVDISYDLRPSLEAGYDLVHVFNVWWPHTALQQMQYLRDLNIPIVWQPIYLRLSEYMWANLAARAVFSGDRPEEERQQLLEALTQGTLQVNGLSRWSQTNEAFPGLFQYLRQMARLADHTCVCSVHEAQGLFQAAQLSNSQFTVVPHGVDPSVFAAADAMLFRSEYGITDEFVLCVAAVDGRKNQLLLTEALRGTRIKLVLVGPCYEPDYLELIRQRGGDNVIYFDRLPQAAVASAYKSARAHVLPSYAEGSALASMEAASTGCPVVVSNRSSEFEYYGDLAYYCDPADPASIRAGVLAASEARQAEPERCEALARRMAEYTWDAAARLTLQAYRRTLAKRPAAAIVHSEHEANVPKAVSPPGRRLGTSSSVLWSAPLFDPSGYADEARNFLTGLDTIGAAVRAQALNWSNRRAELDPAESQTLERAIRMPLATEFVHVQHIFPTHFQHDPGAVASIGRTMFETDRIPESWVERCNAMDEVWVPSDFNLATFACSGVDPRKLRKLPGALDADRFRTPVQPLPLGPKAEGFRFLSIFDWTLRKGWDVLLRAFVEEFSADEDVCLVLKVYSSTGCSDAEIAERVRSYVQGILGPARAPRIVVLGGTYDDLQMRRLYRAASAYVMPSRGEGWGRPLMEAMASGLPTIGTNWSGNTEFMTAENSFLIDYTLTDVCADAVAEAPHFAGHRWAEPSLTQLRQVLRQVFVDRDAAIARGERARHDILERYNRVAVARIAAGHLERLLGRSVAARPAAVELDGRRRVAFLHEPLWQTTEWEDVLHSYLRAFGPEDDTTLVLWLDPDQGISEAEAGERVLSALGRAHIDPEHMADVLLLPDRLDSLGRERLRASVDRVIRDATEFDDWRLAAA